MNRIKATVHDFLKKIKSLLILTKTSKYRSEKKKKKKTRRGLKWTPNVYRQRGKKLWTSHRQLCSKSSMNISKKTNKQTNKQNKYHKSWLEALRPISTYYKSWGKSQKPTEAIQRKSALLLYLLWRLQLVLWAKWPHEHTISHSPFFNFKIIISK